MRLGWWSFDAEGGLLAGVPVDLLLAWAVLWGAIPALALPSAPIALTILGALAVDLILMPLAGPVVRLGPTWLIGEAVALVTVLAPAQLLARWTSRRERLAARAIVQMLAFTLLIFVVLPLVIVESSGGRWFNPLNWPAWQLSLLAQAMAIPALLGLSAVQEFVTRGDGTPVPFDPPARLVTSGVYAYVGNPMQLAAAVLLAVWGLVLGNLWVAAGGAMSHVYASGLAGWDENTDLQRRFGSRWREYRRGVRRWIPRLRPWHPSHEAPARLFVAESCDVCRDVARWFESRGATSLAIVPAETHPSGALRRITYEAADGSRAASGIEAFARALEHIHLGWALVGFFIRLPVVLPLVQLVVDASGGGPRTIPRQPICAPAGGSATRSSAAQSSNTPRHQQSPPTPARR
jgi:protein-S-isoprenylcysteine O-methyltransferase Ste14